MVTAQTNLQLYEQVATLPHADRIRIRHAYDLAAELFAGRYRGSGKPFVAHLVGTASVLARHGGSLDLVLAGLLHAAYEQGDFGALRRGMTTRNRRRLRSVIGGDAEGLVARYTQFDWSQIPDEIAEPDRPVVTLRIANEIDECLDRGLLYAGARKRQTVQTGVARFVRAANIVQLPALGEELQAAAEANRGELPGRLAATCNGSYTIAPPLLSTVLDRFRAARRSREP